MTGIYLWRSKIALNDFFINTTTYYVIAAALYFAAAIFFVLLFSPGTRELLAVYLGKFADKLWSVKAFNILKTDLRKFLAEPMSRLSSLVIRFISGISVHFKKGEEFFTDKILPVIIEPVNLASLLIRKAYTDNLSAVISLTVGLIVAFYFILTIF